MNSDGIRDEYLNSIDWSKYDIAEATDEQFARIEAPLNRFFMKHTKVELFEGAIERGIMLYPVYSPKEIAEDPHLKERGFWKELQHPELGEDITYPDAFVRFSETAYGLRHRAPLIGEHNQEIYAELGLSREDQAILKQGGVI
jgi:formyl-CoA transferase